MFCKDIVAVYCILIKFTVHGIPLSKIGEGQKSMHFYGNTKIDKVVVVNNYCDHGKDNRQTLLGITNNTTNGTAMKNKALQVNASDCQTIKKQLDLKSAVYEIPSPSTKTGFLKVYCDMEDDIGWTVIQRRYNGKVDFYRTWAEYKNGFGNPWGEYWLGNDNIYHLTKAGNYSLKIDMQVWDNKWYYAEYSQFYIGSEVSGYRLHVAGYTGNSGGDSLDYANGMRFSTKDKDNDNNGGSCAITYLGAWWYNSCHYSNLNGQYYQQNEKQKGYATAMSWYYLKKSHDPLKQVVMKIRPA